MLTKHYVIVRDDLPRGVLGAMIVHAAGITGGPHAAPAHAVVLSVPNADALLAVASQLEASAVPHHLVNEPDPPWSGAPMAIGIDPATPFDTFQHVTRRLQLLA